MAWTRLEESGRERAADGGCFNPLTPHPCPAACFACPVIRLPMALLLPRVKHGRARARRRCWARPAAFQPAPCPADRRCAPAELGRSARVCFRECLCVCARVAHYGATQCS